MTVALWGSERDPVRIGVSGGSVPSRERFDVSVVLRRAQADGVDRLEDLIARTPEQYVQIAIDLANDMPRLTQLRLTLRQRMEQSPLMDAPKFARNIEAAYRQMWRTWCQAASAVR